MPSLACMRSCGRALVYVPPELRRDREVVMALIEEDSQAFAAENNIEPRTCE